MFGKNIYICTTEIIIETKKYIFNFRMADQNTLTTFLINTQKALKSHTIEELNAALCVVLKTRYEKIDEVDFVLDITAKAYGISKNTLLKSTSRGKVNVARKLSYCLLNLETGLSTRYIAKRIFQKYQNSISVGILYYKRLDPKIKADREFIEMYEKLRLQILENRKPKNAKNENIQ